MDSVPARGRRPAPPHPGPQDSCAAADASRQAPRSRAGRAGAARPCSTRPSPASGRAEPELGGRPHLTPRRLALAQPPDKSRLGVVGHGVGTRSECQDSFHCASSSECREPAGPAAANGSPTWMSRGGAGRGLTETSATSRGYGLPSGYDHPECARTRSAGCRNSVRRGAGRGGQGKLACRAVIFSDLYRVSPSR